MKILSTDQIYQADQATIQFKPISSNDLMEYAADQCFNRIEELVKSKDKTIHVFCGIGNNGGDGLVVARKLFENSYNVTCYIVSFSKKRSDDFKVNYDRLTQIGVKPILLEEDVSFPKIKEREIVVDAIFGIGITRSLKGFVKEIIQKINKSNSLVISIDFPSGLFAESSVTDKESVIKSDFVLTFQNPKLAFFLPDNAKFCKSWEVLDIDLDKRFINSLETNYETIDLSKIRSIYKSREKFSHKGSFGHSLIIGGSYGKIGAVVLATKSALKIGSGLVTAYIPKCGYQIVQTVNPEVMVEVDDESYLQYFNFKTIPSVIGIGPGLGTNNKTKDGFAKFLKNNKAPLVIDADALNILALHKELWTLIPENSVLTPHPKEFERLVGKWNNDYEKLDLLMKFSKKIKCIVILKGVYTAIAFQNKIYFNTTGNPALATAGSGDVLTGIITGLVAQKYTAIDASILGVYLHGKSADIAIESKETEQTFIASSCIEYLNKAIRSIVT